MEERRLERRMLCADLVEVDWLVLDDLGVDQYLPGLLVQPQDQPADIIHPFR